MAMFEKTLAKVQAVAAAKAAKMADLQPEQIISHEYQQDLNSLDEPSFIQKYGPNAAVEYTLNKFTSAVNSQNPNLLNPSQNTNRFQDVGTGAGISLFDKTPELAASLGYLATAPVDGTTTPYSEWFKEGMLGQQAEAAVSRENYSIGTQESIANQQRLAAIRNAQFDQIENPSARDYGKDFLEATGEYLQNPGAILPLAAESADSFVTMPVGGAIAGNLAKAGVKASLKKGLKEGIETTAEVAAKKIAKAEKTAAGAFGVGYTGISEGGHNAIGTLQQIEGMDLSLLAQSPEFQQMAKDNPERTPEEIRTALALSASKETLLKSGAAAAVIGKATGASDLFTEALLKKGTGVSVGKVLKGAVTEGVEEVLQSGSGQAISNVSAQRADPTIKTMEGVADAAASGLVAGAVTGGAITGIAETGKGTTKAIAKGATVLKDKIASTTETAPLTVTKKWETMDDKQLPEAVDVALKSKDKTEILNAMTTLAVRKSEEINPKKKAKYDIQIEKIKTYLQEATADKEATAKSIQATPDAELDKESTAAGIAIVLNNPTAEYSADLSQKISGSKHLTENQRVLLQEASKPDSPLVRIMRKTQEDVANDIYHGSEGYTGLAQYSEIITEALHANDMNTTIRALSKLNILNKSHKEKARTGKTRLLQPIGEDLLNVIKDESVAIDMVYQGLRDSALALFPDYEAEANQQSKRMTERVNEGGLVKDYQAPSVTTVEPKKRIAIVGEALTSLLDTEATSVNADVGAFRRALANKGNLGSKAIPALKEAFEGYTTLSKVKHPSGEQKAQLKGYSKTLLNAYDVLNASDVGGRGKLQKVLQAQAGTRDISSLFNIGEIDPLVQDELNQVTNDIAQKKEQIKAAKAAKDTAAVTVLTAERNALTDKAAELKQQIATMVAGQVSLIEADKKPGHTPEAKIRNPENRTKYEALYASLENNQDILSQEQAEKFALLPAAFTDLSENVVEDYNALVDIINEVELVNSTVNAAEDDQAINPTTPKNRVFKNTIESLPLFSVVRKAFKYVLPRRLGLLHVEADLFQKIEANGAIANHLTAYMSEGTKGDLVALSSFVTGITKALQKSIVKEDKRDARSWINTVFKDFINEAGHLDNAVADAVAIGLADWLHTSGLKSILSNSDEMIAHNLGMSGEEARRYVPTSNERKVLRYAGINRNLAINTIGKKILQNLGYALREDTNDAQRHLEETLINNLGMLAIVAGETHGNKGVVETNYIHRFTVKNAFGTTRSVVLTDSHLKVDPAKHGIKGNAVYEGSPVAVLRAIKRETTAPETQLTVAATNAVQGMSNVHLVRDVLGVVASDIPVYMAGEKMPKSEEYQSYGSAIEHTAINNQNSIEHTLNESLFHFVMGLTPEQQVTLLDNLPPEGQEHIDNEKRNNDIRNSIKLEFEGAKRIYERMLSENSPTVRFINNLVKTNRRVNQGGSDGNPGNSKLVRELFIPQHQRVTIDPSDASHMLAFKIAVLHGLDNKIPTLDAEGNPTTTRKGVDKSTNAAIESAWETLMNDSIIMNAAEGLLTGDTDKVFTALPRSGIKAGSGDSYMHRLHALQALGTWQKSKTSPFEVTLGKEDDGIVNGTAALRMQGMGSTSVMGWLLEAAKVGIYLNDSEMPSSFAEYTKEEGRLDPYESIASSMKSALEHPEENPFNEWSILPVVPSDSKLFNKPISWLNANRKKKISVVTPDGKIKEVSRSYFNPKSKKESIHQTYAEHQTMSKALSFIVNFVPEAGIQEEIIEIARSFTKDSLMQKNYQAGMQGLKVALMSKFETALRNALEQISRLPAEAKESASRALEKQVNALSFMDQATYQDGKYHNDIPWKFVIDKDPLKTPITHQVRNNIGVAVEFTYGPAMEIAFRKDYSLLNDNMAHVVNMTRMATKLYSQMYAELEKEILKETGQLSLSVKQEKEIRAKLKNYSPAVAHAMSKDRTNDGMIAGEKESIPNRDEFGKELNPETNSVKLEYIGRGGKKTSMKSVTFSRQMTDPGVSAVALFTQSTDAATNKTGMLRKESFTNTHDAKTLQLLESMEHTIETNKDFFEVHKNYSFVEATLEMFREMLKSPLITAEMISKTYNEVALQNGSLLPFSGVEDYFTFLEDFNKDLQKMRKDVFSLDLVVHQFYNSDGSAYITGGTKTIEELTVPTVETEIIPVKHSKFESFKQKTRQLFKEKYTNTAKAVTAKQNQIMVASKYIAVKGHVAEAITSIFEPENVNTPEFTSEDRVFLALEKAKEVGVENDPSYELIKKAIEANATFVTGSATTILEEGKSLLEGGEWGMALFLSAEGYVPRIYQGTLLWSQGGGNLAATLTLLKNLSTEEIGLYQKNPLTGSFVFNEQDHSNFAIESLSTPALAELLKEYSPEDSRFKIIQNQLNYRRNIQEASGQAVTIATEQAIKKLSNQDLINKLEQAYTPPTSETGIQRSPGSALAQALLAEFQKRVDAGKMKQIPLPNFKGKVPFEELDEFSKSILENNLETENEEFIKAYYRDSVSEKGIQGKPRQDLPEVTAKALSGATNTTGMITALKRYFTSPTEKIILDKIFEAVKASKVEIQKISSGAIHKAFVSGDITEEVYNALVSNTEGLLFHKESNKVFLVESSIPVNNPEDMINFHLNILDRIAISHGLTQVGVESTPGYAGLVQAYQRFYGINDIPSKVDLKNFIVAARYDKTVKTKLESTPASKGILASIRGFLRNLFKMDAKTFSEYDVLMGYAAQSVYGNKHLSAEILADIERIEAKSFKKPERIAAKNELLRLLMQGNTLEQASHRMLQNKTYKEVNAIVLKEISKKGALNFSSPITPEQYRNDDAIAVEEDMTFTNTSTMDVFDSLESYGTANSEHTAHLKYVLNLAAPALDKLRLLVRTHGIKESYGSEQGNTIDLRINTGAKANNLEMSPQELFVHETYHALFRTLNAKQTPIWRKLKSEYARAAKYLEVKDFLAHIPNPTLADRTAASKLMDHALFNATPGSIGYNTALGEQGELHNADPVEEFVVLATTNEAVKNALKNLDMRLKGESNPATGILARVIDAFHSLINWVTDKIYNLEGLTGDARIIKLIEHLTGSQNAAQSSLYRAMLKVDAGIDATGDWVKTTLGNTSLVRGVKFGSALYLDSVLGNIRKWSHDSEFTKNKLFEGIANEFTNGRLGLAKLTRLLTKSSYFIERKSQQIIEYIAREIMEVLPELNSEDSTALYSTLLEADTQSLLNTHTIDEVYALLSDPAKRIDRINALTTELFKLSPNQYARFMKYHAEDLGYHMVTGGRLLTDGMYTNASQIANLWGYEGVKPKSPVEKITPILDEIATLYAIGYSLGKDSVQDIFSDARYGIKALETVLLLQREVVEISAKEGFENDKFNMRKGYIREKVSNDVEVVTGTTADHERLLSQGYTRSHPLVQDPSVTHVANRWYYTKQGGQQAYLTGVLSTVTNSKKGTNIFEPTEGMDELGVLRMEHDFQYMKKVKQAEMRKTMSARQRIPKVKPTQAGSIAQPMFDSVGKITGYRMILTHAIKNEMLHRETDFHKGTGYTLAGISRKKQSKVINKELMDYLFETYQEEYSEFPREFIELSSTSESDNYYLIPEETREYAKTLFGSNSVFVRREQFNIAFGYRKFSVAQLKHDAHPTANAFREILRLTNNVAALAFNNRVGITAEAYIQSFVATAKDVLVIKSGVVTAANILSNVLLLWWSGVPLAQAVIDHAVAYKETFAYNKAHREIFRITRKMSDPNISDLEFKTLSAKRAVLRQELYHNPVRELIEAGLYQTIVDDVETSENVSEARSKIDEFLEPVAKRIPDPVKTVGKYFIMSHDTKIYQAFRDVAQISDFAARYSLHKYNMSQGVSFEESIRDVKTTFVEYDIPQMKSLQYLNDMGLMGFTKWFFRMQQVLVKKFGAKPARGMMLILLQNMFGGISNPVQGAITGFDGFAQRIGIDWVGAMEKGAVHNLVL